MRKKAKKKTKSLPQLKKALQLLVNAYIRKRDVGLPCISCGEFKTDIQAGHFYAVKGYDGLRYELDNINGECSGCNCFNESHLIGYSENLLKKIGKKRFEALKEKAKDYKKNGYKWSRSELEGLIEEFKIKLSE